MAISKVVGARKGAVWWLPVDQAVGCRSMPQVATGRFTLHIPGRAPEEIQGTMTLRAIEATQLPIPAPVMLDGTVTFTMQGRRTLRIWTIMQNALSTAQRILA